MKITMVAIVFVFFISLDVAKSGLILNPDQRTLQTTSATIVNHTEILLTPKMKNCFEPCKHRSCIKFSSKFTGKKTKKQQFDRCLKCKSRRLCKDKEVTGV